MYASRILSLSPFTYLLLFFFTLHFFILHYRLLTYSPVFRNVALFILPFLSHHVWIRFDGWIFFSVCLYCLGFHVSLITVSVSVSHIAMYSRPHCRACPRLYPSFPSAISFVQLFSQSDDAHDLTGCSTRRMPYSTVPVFRSAIYSAVALTVIVLAHTQMNTTILHSIRGEKRDDGQ